jgi:hypothetical protein
MERKKFLTRDAVLAADSFLKTDFIWYSFK